MRRPGGQASPQAAELTENERKALDLRIAGKTFQQIAEALGAPRTSAYRWVTTALSKADEAMAENAKDHRELEAQRLDALFRSILPQALTGDARCIETALKVMDRRAKLLGLDAPTKAELTGKDGGALQTETIARVVVLPPERDDGRVHADALESEPGAADRIRHDER